MMISSELAAAINEQIGHEFTASLQYLSIASHFDSQHLALLAKLFFKQAEEEHQHGLKLLHYLVDTKAGLNLPAVPAPTASFASSEDAVAAAVAWEHEVTRRINALIDQAVADNDYLAQGFLQWFVDEQLEEVTTMERLLAVVRQAGEHNLLMVEAYLVHLDKAG
jgi:ferritin